MTPNDDPPDARPARGKLDLAFELRHFVRLEPRETVPVLWAFLFNLGLFWSYFLVRPLREEMGLVQGVKNLPNLFLVTMGAMVVCHLLFAGLVSRTPRRTFVPALYHFIAASLVLLFVLHQVSGAGGRVWVARVLYVWVSVYNLFAFSVFWGLMADGFPRERAGRLFVFIGAGGTIGGILGSLSASLSAGRVEPILLLLISALILELSVLCFYRLSAALEATSTTGWRERPAVQPVVSGALEGVERIVRSPYLIGVCLFLFLYSFTSSALYFERQSIIAGQGAAQSTHIRLFAHIDLVVQSATAVLQLVLAKRLVQWAGIAACLAVLPAFTGGGFAALAAVPTQAVAVSFDVARKILNYSVTRPCREMLFAVLDRAEKYKSKTFIDTFVYRGGDSLAAACASALGYAAPVVAVGSLDVHTMIVVAVAVSILWMGVAFLLGWRQRQLAGAEPPALPEEA